MSSTLDDLKDLKLYKQQIYMPVNDKDRKHHSLMFLMAPNIKSSIKTLEHIDRFFKGVNNWPNYYMEKDISFYINNENQAMKIDDRLILEDGSYEVQVSVKDTLSEFKRLEINETSLDEYITSYDELQGIVEYYPWTGYLYVDESDKLIAGVNVNVDTRNIQKIFVTEDKYKYLYKDLISEARKLKGNIIVCDRDDGCVEPLKEFGFSIVEDIGDKLKLQFKVPIEESVKFYGTNHELHSYINHESKYKAKGAYNGTVTGCLIDAVEYYVKKLGCNPNLGYVMAKCFTLENFVELLSKDLMLRKWLSETDIAIAITAIDDAITQREAHSIYSRIMMDCSLLIHHTDIELIIRDMVNEYFEFYELEPRDFLFDEEVPIISDMIRYKYSKYSINDWGLRISYEYYRDRRRKLLGKLKGSLDYLIRTMYHVKKIETYQEGANLLLEANTTFGYPEEKFEVTSEEWEVVKKSIKPSSGFVYNEEMVDGIVISSGDVIKGAVHVGKDNQIVDLYTEDISWAYMINLAGRKFGADKVRVPITSTDILEAFDNNMEWTNTAEDKDFKYYETNARIDRMEYPHIPMKDDEKSLYMRLDEEAKKGFTSHYLEDSDVSNTIYRRAYKDTGFINLYCVPEFPKIAFVNIAVLEEKRNNGWASVMLEDVCKELRSKFPKIQALGWSCDKNNEASYKTAVKNNFVPYYENDDRMMLVKYVMTNQLQANVFTEEYSEDTTVNPEYLSETMNYSGVYTLVQEEVDKNLGNVNNKFKRILWDDRIKNDKKILEIYDEVKRSVAFIKRTYLKLDLYKEENLIFDTSYYLNSFINNYSKILPVNNDEAYRFYYTFLSRVLSTKRFSSYNTKTCIVPINRWYSSTKEFSFNPLDTCLYILRKYPEMLHTLSGIDFIVYNTDTDVFFKVDFSKLDKSDYNKIKSLTKSVSSKVNEVSDTKMFMRQSKKTLIHSILDDMEVRNKISIKSIDKNDEPDPKKKEMIKKIDDATDKATDSNEVGEELDKDEEKVKELIDNIADNEPGNVKLSAARSKRLDALCQKFLNQKVTYKQIKNYSGSMEKYLTYNQYSKELPETELPIDSINEGWKHLQYINFEKVYDLRADIFQILYFISTRSVRLGINGQVDIKDTSTSEDWIETWTVPFETDEGKRFSFKFDLPILKDNRFMVLGGNDKTINGQLVLIPISKTEEDTVQIVSNYNKIFIRRYSSGICKANRNCDYFAKFIEIMAKEHPHTVSIKYGNSNMSNTKYSLPFDYVDIGETYYSVTINNKGDKLVLYFNQDELRKQLNIKEDDKIYLGYIESHGKKTIIEMEIDGDKYSTCSDQLVWLLKDFLSGTDYIKEYFDKLKPSTKYCYSRASILGTEIPVIIIMAYNEGLQEALRKGHIDYQISEKRIDSLKYTHDCIRFKDCYLYYKDDYNSSLLMNGLKIVDTEQYSFQEIDDKMMWTVFLDDFGGRIKADGLDNFYDLMIDPITKEVCDFFKVPSDYCELLAYSNLLLADNDFIKHTDLASNRFRTNELIAAKAYKCIATAYSEFRIQRKKERANVIMTMKQTAILDALLSENTMSDMSVNNPLGEIESKNTVSFKGHVGLNSDRSYGIEKRNYDPSMINKIALSTGFAGNVGVNRQTTINMNIKGTRGYIKNTDMSSADVTNTLSMTEALTPFGSTRDDPFRTAMTNIQTNKHNMRTKTHNPLLVTSGADQAMPYLTGDNFSFKAKGNGKVVKVTKDYIIVEYDADKNKWTPYGDKAPEDIKRRREIIDLRELIKKNSDGGFYITVKLDSDLKPGQRFKAMDILAYDKDVYSNTSGDGKHITYELGALANVAYMNTDEGFEDSAIISDRLANALASEIVVCVSKNLPANTNIFSMVSKGQAVQEGDTLMLFQAPFDEEDANVIIRNLAAMDKDQVSELGRIPLKAKETGIIQDIKIYRTVDYSEMSPSLKKICKAYDDALNDISNEAAKADNKIDLDANYKLEPVSKMKNCEGKVKIEFYIKYFNKMGIGDKLVFFSAIKGETKNIFPVGQEPYTDSHPNEIVDSLCPLPSVLHRMVASVKIQTGLNKGIIELTRYMKEAIGLKYDPYNAKPKTSK